MMKPQAPIGHCARSQPARLCMVLSFSLFLAACTAGTVTDSDGPPAPPSDTTTNPGGTVQRATLTVHVWIVDPADSSIAAVAGVTTTALTARLTRDVSSDAPRTAETRADGTARFEGLLQGTYQVSVDRALTAAELSRLPVKDRDASIFAGGASVYVSPPAKTTDITLVAARRGSLVLSEVYIYAAYVPMVGNNGHYMEVYNNADTTIYLDGILVFRTSGILHQDSPFHPCALNVELRLDPTGIWASTIHRFPGSGRDYAIHPGEAKVVATDALNHGLIGEGMPDLSRAEFELIGDDGDPNNPYAADMIRMTEYSGMPPHGEALQIGNLMGLALPVARDTTQLVRGAMRNTTTSTRPVFKIPREAVLDVAGFNSTPEYDAAFGVSGGGYCEPFASPVFERAAARLGNMNVPMAISRKSLGRTALGAEILQRTHTAARDFELASPLRRSLFK